MIVLPPDFVQTIQATFREDGQRWLAALPGLLEEASQRWGLTDIRPVPGLSYNFVAFASSGVSDGEPLAKADVVLKLGVPNRELTGEIAALRLYNGRGACRLLGADAEKGMLLLERLTPGHMLATLEDDDRATEIAADTMRQLWGCSSALNRSANNAAAADFIRLKDWFDGFRRLRRRYRGKAGPLPEHLVAMAESRSHELLSGDRDEVLLHGDLHHFNLLMSARGWLAIDPKGVIGPRGYELGPFLINPKPGFLQGSNPRGQMERRIAMLSERLGMGREHIRAWGICYAVLSAWWGVEDNDPDWGTYGIRCAEILAQV
jgi:streptomycin 6-kinase